MAAESKAPEITPDLLLQAYSCGIFPMAENADDPELHWYEPRRRGIMPLEAFHVPRSLAKTVRSGRFEVVADRDFDAVMAGCAAAAPGREKTWINATIRRLYRDLFDRGFCHCVEARRDGELVGGLYGVSIGGAFFGESMFHRATDASKVALVHLVGRLRRGGYRSSTRNSLPTTSRHSAPSRSTGTPTGRCWRRRSRAARTSGPGVKRCPAARPSPPSADAISCCATDR